MNKKAIGIDHCKFNLFFKTQQNNNNEVIPIISPHHFEFGEILTERGIETTVRRKLGSDINAACGQLRRRYMADNSKETL